MKQRNMLKFNSETNTYTIPMPTRNDYVTAITIKDKLSSKSIIVAPLTAEQELKLDSGQLIEIKTKDCNFRVDKRNVYFYGVIDFNKDSNDYAIMCNSPICDDLGTQGRCVPSDYDYEEHVCNSPISKPRYYETWKPGIILRYCYAMLGKPERTVIFRIKRQ